MTEELHYKIPIIRQLPLKPSDASNPLFIGFLIHLVMKAFPCHFIHPAGIQKSVLSGLRYLRKIPAQKRLPKLLRRRLIHGCHLKKPGINILDDLSDKTSLSGCPPALHQHQHRNFMILDLHLQSKEFFPRFL